MEECNALTIGRKEAEYFLRERGYGGLQAREVASRLIPHVRATPEKVRKALMVRLLFITEKLDPGDSYDYGQTPEKNWDEASDRDREWCRYIVEDLLRELENRK